MRTLSKSVTALTTSIQTQIVEYVENADAKGVVIGVSGGIDSAVVCGLCAPVVNTKALIMPDVYTSKMSDIEDAQAVCDTFDVKYEEIDITKAYDALIGEYPGDISPHPIAQANIKPRLRMINLYICANSEKRLVAGTGNKTEKELGYFTKWGDGAADFSVIGALWKTEVIDLARHLKVPHNVIEKPPSAGILPNQTDEGEIGAPYEIIDEILSRLIDNDESIEEIEKEIGNNELVRSLIARRTSNLHKAKVPPILEVDL